MFSSSFPIILCFLPLFLLFYVFSLCFCYSMFSSSVRTISRFFLCSNDVFTQFRVFLPVFILFRIIPVFSYYSVFSLCVHTTPVVRNFFLCFTIPYCLPLFILPIVFFLHSNCFRVFFLHSNCFHVFLLCSYSYVFYCVHTTPCFLTAIIQFVFSNCVHTISCFLSVFMLFRPDFPLCLYCYTGRLRDCYSIRLMRL